MNSRELQDNYYVRLTMEEIRLMKFHKMWLKEMQYDVDSDSIESKIECYQLSNWTIGQLLNHLVIKSENISINGIFKYPSIPIVDNSISQSLQHSISTILKFMFLVSFFIYHCSLFTVHCSLFPVPCSLCLFSILRFGNSFHQKDSHK
jgi:hypothetical protein